MLVTNWARAWIVLCALGLTGCITIAKSADGVPRNIYVGTTMSSTGPVPLHVHGAVAIPVGHRVEIHVYYGTDSSEPQFEYPLIADLETGIQYGALGHFHEDFSAYREGQLFEAQVTPMPNLREHSRWRGKVLVCNVLFTGIKRSELQTTLLIEPMPVKAGPSR